MKFKTPFGTYEGVVLKKGNYTKTGAIALQLWNNEGCVATITVCLPDEEWDRHKRAENETYLDVNNCPFAPDFIREYRLGEPAMVLKYSGHCAYPLWRLNMEKLNELATDL